MNKNDLQAALIEDMHNKHIDIDLTLSILNRFNRGELEHYEKIISAGVPDIDGTTVIDLRDENPDMLLFHFPKKESLQNLEILGISTPAQDSLFRDNVVESIKNGKNILHFNAVSLRSIGREILSKCAYGVLNGGSATSYCDKKKNCALNEKLFDILEPIFDRLASEHRFMPKGLTPAYINPDGSSGASFLELKMRMRMLLAQRFGHNARSANTFMPLFQMTSENNHALLFDAYSKLTDSPLLRPLADRVHIDPVEWSSGIQPLIAAYSHSEEGRPKRIFDFAYGKKNSTLPLPGGHGQCFAALSDIFRNLKRQGFRYAMLSNVDNLGAYPDPIEIGILAISGKPAAFDFSYKTAIDVKGGILIHDTNNSKNIVDIGPVIDFQEVSKLEAAGKPILFNCASGIFDLDWLVPNLERIAQDLPIRFSDQNKDAGRYSQAEQVTWEVVSLLPDFIAFAVEKKKRFIAAKMLTEMLLSSGSGLENESLPQEFREMGTMLHAGQNWLLKNVYGMHCLNGRWIPDDTFQPEL